MPNPNVTVSPNMSLPVPDLTDPGPDYASNVKLYPQFQKYFRTHRPPTLAVWGKSDPFFLPAGANAFKRDNPGAQVVFFDTGHFALETHSAEIGAKITEFLTTIRPSAVSP